ncbi:MAG: response regulator, partial [Spirochaetota bacterium]
MMVTGQGPALKKILLVEDEAIIAMAQARRIQAFGYQVLAAYNGDEAERLVLEAQDISLVLMDIDLGTGPDG